MSIVFRNLGQIPEETAHVLQNLVSANGLIKMCIKNAKVGDCSLQ